MQPLYTEDPEHVERTDESTVEDDIKEPFDPKDINITVEPKTMDNLVQRLNHNNLDPDFQCKGNLWAMDSAKPPDRVADATFSATRLLL